MEAEGLIDEDELCKTVYAHFGLAVFRAQCVEQSLIQLLIFFKFFPDHLSGYTIQKQWESDFDAFDAALSAKTMGQLLTRLRELNVIGAEISEKLSHALKVRNFLAHSYFSYHAITFMDNVGRMEMILELEGYTALFNEVEDILKPISDQIARQYGMTEEALKEVEAQMLVEARDSRGRRSEL